MTSWATRKVVDQHGLHDNLTQKNMNKNITLKTQSPTDITIITAPSPTRGVNLGCVLL